MGPIDSFGCDYGFTKFLNGLCYRKKPCRLVPLMSSKYMAYFEEFILASEF